MTVDLKYKYIYNYIIATIWAVEQIRKLASLVIITVVCILILGNTLELEMLGKNY